MCQPSFEKELYERLAAGTVGAGTKAKLIALVEALEKENWALANRLNVEMTSESDFDKNRKWLFAVKLLIPRL